jgi:hypothetical protein
MPSAIEEEMSVTHPVIDTGQNSFGRSGRIETWNAASAAIGATFCATSSTNIHHEMGTALPRLSGATRPAPWPGGK